MSAQILRFRLKNRPGRKQALQWLSVNSVGFPNIVEKSIGDDLFFGWRFIQATDGVIYFADCIHEGIVEEELKQFCQFRLESF